MVMITLFSITGLSPVWVLTSSIYRRRSRQRFTIYSNRHLNPESVKCEDAMCRFQTPCLKRVRGFVFMTFNREKPIYSTHATNREEKNENDHEEIDSCVLAAFHGPAGRRVSVRCASLLPPRSHKHSLANGDRHHQYRRSNGHRHPEGL